MMISLRRTTGPVETQPVVGITMSAEDNGLAQKKASAVSRKKPSHQCLQALRLHAVVHKVGDSGQ